MLADIWHFLKDKDNLAIVVAAGSAIGAIVAGAWRIITFRAKKKGEKIGPPPITNTNTNSNINTNNNNATVQIGLNEEAVARMLEEKLANIARERGVGEAPLRVALKGVWTQANFLFRISLDMWRRSQTSWSNFEPSRKKHGGRFSN